MTKTDLQKDGLTLIFRMSKTYPDGHVEYFDKPHPMWVKAVR